MNKNDEIKISGKIYCGAKNPPKGTRRGTQKECVDNQQVRFYGIEKIDPEMLKNKQPTKAKQLMNIRIQIAKNNGIKSRLKRQLEVETKRKVKDENKIQDIREQGKKIVQIVKDLRIQYRKLNDQ